MKKLLISIFLLLFTATLNAEIIKKIEISGNERVSDETVKVYGDISINENVDNLKINEIGVTTKKKTKPITIGETIPPKIIPNLNHILFKGDKILEFNNPRIKKIKLKIINQIFTLSSLSNWYKAIIKNTIEKTIPKLLFDPILIFLSSIN